MLEPYNRVESRRERQQEIEDLFYDMGYEDHINILIARGERRRMREEEAERKEVEEREEYFRECMKKAGL
tara:strand:+ start:92 stop:301 length:210 start_codon:yes stop_codon:yes gene_type:complete